jgi:hypothetical protein
MHNPQDEKVRLSEERRPRYNFRVKPTPQSPIGDDVPDAKRRKQDQRSSSVDASMFQKRQEQMQRKLQKHPVKVKNQFDSLADGMDIDPEDQNSNYRPALLKTRQRGANESQSKIKPIILWKTTHEITNRFIDGLGLKCKRQKLRTPGAYQVFPNNKEEKVKILAGLREDSSRQFHTYTETDDRQLMFVLKGFEFMKDEEVLEILKAEKLNANKVTRIGKVDQKTDYPVYKVSFAKGSINFAKLNNEHRYIDHLKVSWEKLLQSTRRPTQCKRCQAWGHAAVNCGRAYRCMKCKENHEPKECKRTKDDETPPYCVNCQKEGHLSSSWDCESYKRYNMKIQARRQQHQPREFVKAPAAPWAQQNPSGSQDPSDHFGPSGPINGPYGNRNYPPLPGTAVSSQCNTEQVHSRPIYQPSQTRPQANPTLEDLSHEFDEIPGIHEATAILSDFFGQLRRCQDKNAQARLIFRFLYPQQTQPKCL